MSTPNLNPNSSPSLTARDELVQRLRDVLSRRPLVREVRMFGGLAFMVDEQMAVSAGRDGGLLVRVDPASSDELLERGATPAFMGRDRPMGPGWLMVQPDQLIDDTELAFWVKVGIDSRNSRA